MAMNDYFAAVHGIATAVLSIAVDNDPGTIHECPQVITRSAKYLNIYWSVQVGTNISLPIDIMELDSLGAI